MPITLGQRLRIAVIGAGIVGVHVAAELARRGADVTLIDAAEPGGGTTSGSFAWIDASHPGIADYLELRLLGIRGWQRQAAEFGRPSWLSLNGTLAWARASDDAATLEAHAERLERHGHAPERLTAQAALEREAALRVARDVEVVYRFEGEGWVQTGPAIAALLKRGRAAGLRLRAASEVRELSFDGEGRGAAVTLMSGDRVSADVVVSCVGRWTQSLLAPAGVEAPMLRSGSPEAVVQGVVARTSPVSPRIGSVILADGLLIRPETGGRLLLHSNGHDATLTDHRAEPTGEELLALLVDRVRDTRRARVEAARRCVRAIPGDLLPIAGWALDRLYVVATHSGVTLAPALGELVAAELLADEEREELARFRPGRFRSVPA